MLKRFFANLKRGSGLALLLLALLLCRMIPVKAADAPVFSETQSDVTVTLTTDKAEYYAGETIKFTLTVTNGRLRYYTSKAQFSYTNTEGLDAVGELETVIQKLESGESATITGEVVGNAAVFPAVSPTLTPTPVVAPGPSTQTATGFNMPVIIVVGIGLLSVVAAVVIVILLVRNNKKGAGRLGAVLLALIIGAGVVPIKAADYDTLTFRPYVLVQYAGQEVMIRMVIELHSYPKRIIIPSEKKSIPKAITCHDPSIFKDKDGTYYIFGTHITGGYTTDLRNWTSIDGTFRASFTEETKKKIREWNTDSGDWWSYLWAPDVVWNPVLEKYCYYLSANGDNWKSNIVMLTSDTVTGPYEYAGTVVYGGFSVDDVAQTDALQVLGTDTLPDRYITYGVKNRKWGDKWPNVIDPCVFYDDDGKLWMSYGSWSGGIFLLELDENTGLRDYNVSYATDNHSDAYFGKKIAGGKYVSGEASYIQKIGNYYWLFVSYGGLEAKNGYNIRVFRSKTVDGDYRDLLGNSPIYDSYINNYNQSVGVRLFGSYKWRTFNQGQVAQGHNSAIVDDDGRAYIVYHTRTTDGTEGHTVKVHQLFLNREEWLVAAPYITDNETLNPSDISMEAMAGEYDVIIHDLYLKNNLLECNLPKYITLNADGTITGDFEGTWSINAGTSYIYLNFNDDSYSGVALKMHVENTTVDTYVFTALGGETQITIWGSKSIE